MNKLNLPSLAYQAIMKQGKSFIFDTQRKKYVRLTPEEWVRQHMVNYLITHLSYPAGLLSVEAKASISTKSGQWQRADIVVYNRKGLPKMIVECKAPTQRLNQSTIQQMMRYNTQRIPYMLFTNGHKHFCFQLKQKPQCYTLCDTIPSFIDS